MYDSWFYHVADACRFMYIAASLQKRLISGSEFLKAGKYDKESKSFYVDGNDNPVIWVDEEFFRKQRQHIPPTSYKRGELLSLKYNNNPSAPEFQIYNPDEMLGTGEAAEKYELSVDFVWEQFKNGTEKISYPYGLHVKWGVSSFTIPFDLDYGEFTIDDNT